MRSPDGLPHFRVLLAQDEHGASALVVERGGAVVDRLLQDGDELVIGQSGRVLDRIVRAAQLGLLALVVNGAVR